jgi:hypothetical protein
MTRILVIFIACLLGAIALICYGQYWPNTWQTRVPTTNMKEVERSVGKPSHVSTNKEGIIKWDYTRWWSRTASVYFHTNGDFYRIFTE